MSLNLPSLTSSIAHAPSPITTTTNPGCVDVASQGASNVLIDHSVSSTISSASSVNSNGEVQIANSLALCQGTMSVTKCYGSLVHASGEGGQRLDHQKAVQAASTGQGLPANVDAGTVNHAMYMGPNIALCSPVAVTVNAGSLQPGGLASNVNIR